MNIEYQKDFFPSGNVELFDDFISFDVSIGDLPPEMCDVFLDMCDIFILVDAASVVVMDSDETTMTVGGEVIASS